MTTTQMDIGSSVLVELSIKVISYPEIPSWLDNGMRNDINISTLGSFEMSRRCFIATHRNLQLAVDLAE